MDAFFGAIDKYGIRVVFIGLLLYLLYLIVTAVIKWIQAKSETKNKTDEQTVKADNDIKTKQSEIQNMKEIISMINEIKDMVSNGPTHTVEEQNQDIAYHNFIQRQLEGLVDNGADRAYFLAMHNGGRDFLGQGLMKMSITSEAMDSDCAGIMRQYQNVPRALFQNLYCTLNDEEFYDIPDVEAIKQTDVATYQYLNTNNAKTALFRSIKTTNGLIVGILVVEFVNNPVEDFERMSRKATNSAQRIMGAINIKGDPYNDGRQIDV